MDINNRIQCKQLNIFELKLSASSSSGYQKDKSLQSLDSLPSLTLMLRSRLNIITRILQMELGIRIKCVPLTFLGLKYLICKLGELDQFGGLNFFFLAAPEVCSCVFCFCLFECFVRLFFGFFLRSTMWKHQERNNWLHRDDSEAKWSYGTHAT